MTKEGTIEDKEKEYRDKSGYICNEIRLYPITTAQQEKLRKLFELLEIKISPKLIGHTQIFIATKDLDWGVINRLMDQ